MTGGLCLAALLLFVAGRCLVPMDETDLFYNLRLGDIILETGTVPGTNLLSFTVPDYPDPNLAWLFQVVLALAHRAGGIAGTVLLKTAFVVTTFALLFRVAVRRGAHPTIAAAALALAAWAAEPRFVERPHLVTFVGLAVLLLALERAEAERPMLLWMMLPLGMIWANGNSCFFLAPTVLMLYAAGARLDGSAGGGRPFAGRAALVGLLMIPLLFATPSGSGWIGYVANHFRMPRLRPLQEYRLAEWPLDGPFLFLLMAVAGVTVAWRLIARVASAGSAVGTSPEAALASRAGRSSPGLARTLVPTLGLALLGSRRIRFVAEFALLAGPFVAATGTATLAALFRAPRGGALRSATFLVVAGLLLATLAPRLAAVRSGEPFVDLSVEDGLVPERAVRWLDEHGLRDNLYNDLEVGSYLAWEGWPAHRVFQDPRINGYPPELHAILRRPDLEPAAWQALLDRFGVQAALITFPAVNPRAALFDPARWALCLHSAEALVFVRRSEAGAPLIAAEELPVSFRKQADGTVEAVPLLSRPPLSPLPACEWSRRVGNFQLARGDRAAASHAFALALDAAATCLQPEAIRSTREQAASLALHFGEPDRALRLLDGVDTASARRNRAFALLQTDRPEQALAALERAVAAAPDDADAAFGRALALARLGRESEAEPALRDFLARWPEHLAAPRARTLLRVPRPKDFGRENGGGAPPGDDVSRPRLHSPL